ncbi:MAG: T9SS C-terminal target domain-containing protein [Calditrichaeota bacterium]|nr:MAG: T9SS C-terminal target domain-containing protein [Calditrichota bacterium]MBL1206913.1 T9SS C-terminal target domain-containing protein [Calditrichota bacterium]NOG46740.1 T9SS type A sorting domain-containing protein [Calditrichota bacterium]
MKYSILFFLFLSTIFASPIVESAYSGDQDESWKLYDDTEMAVVNITTSQDAVDYMFDNPSSDSLHYASLHFKNALIDETIDSVGIRIRGNTSRNSQKKSFKLDFEHFKSGREFYNVDKMNLNGEHNDPSIIRAKLAWDFFQEIGVKSSRASHAKVYINGSYYGLYISVEHYDKEFLKKNFSDDTGNLWKCLWPVDLVYKGDDPDSYKFYQGSRQVYDLKTNEELDDYSKLANLIDVINNSTDSNFARELEQVLDVPSVLKYMAMNVLLGSWDDYWSNVNNIYLYHQPSIDKFYWIPYDYDNTMGIDWFNIDWATVDIYNWPKINDRSRPLTDRLLVNDQYRNLYSHFISFFSENVYALSLWEDRLSGLYNQILQPATEDTFRTKDYGFTTDDFTNSFTASHFSSLHVKRGIREFVNMRNQSLPAQISYKDANPNIYNVKYSKVAVLPSDSIKISASIFAHPGFELVELHYKLNGADEFIKSAFKASPVQNSKKVEDFDRWQVILPPLGENGSIDFVIFAKDNNGNIQFYPQLETINVSTFTSGNENIFINEILAVNQTGLQDEAGEADDWLELYNTSPSDVDLSGYFLTDKKDNLTKWAFPVDSSTIPGNGFLIAWCDEDQQQGVFHTNFKLSSAGEFVALVAPDGVTIVDSFSFGAQTADISYGRHPDASDNLKFLSPTPGLSNSPTAITHDDFLPQGFKIVAYPNPFNGELIIKYNLPQKQDVVLTIFDMMGRKVWYEVIKNNQAGEHSFKWYGGSQNGSSVSSGQYFIQLKSAKYNQSRKILLIK